MPALVFTGGGSGRSARSPTTQSPRNWTEMTQDVDRSQGVELTESQATQFTSERVLRTRISTEDLDICAHAASTGSMSPFGRSLSQGGPISPNRSETKGRLATFTEHMFLKEKPPEYVLLPGGQAIRNWEDPWDCGSCCPVLDPQISDFVEKWDMIMMTAVLVVAVWCPIEVAFVRARRMRLGVTMLFDHFMDVVFLADMVLQFMMSFPEDREGTTRWVRERGKIVLHYLSGWFWLDLMALIPFDLILTVTASVWPTARSADVIGNLKVLRLLRLFRLMKMGRLVKKWQAAWGVSYGNMALMKFAFLTVMAVHWMSCMWGWLALRPVRNGLSKRTWMHQLFVDKHLDDDDIEFYSEPMNVYIISLYWAVMTLTSLGYGDINAVNMDEYLFCIFCFVTSGLIWAYVIGSICGIISAMDPLLLQYQQNMDLLNIMMQDNNLPEDMRRRLRLYFQESRNLQRKVNQQTVVATLSPGLQGELAMKISHDWLARVWYFDVLDSDPVIEISKRLKPMIFASGEPLLLNNNTRTLFIVVRGVAARGGVVLGKNCVVGDDMIISSNFLRHAARPVCITFIEVNYLRNENLDEVRQAYPLAEQRIRKAQVKWALRRGFVLAAWHRVNHGGNLAGPRSTDYFKQEMPTFSNRETMEAYSSEVTPRGSSFSNPNSSKLKRGWSAQFAPKARRQSLGMTGMGMAAIGNTMAFNQQNQMLAASARQRADEQDRNQGQRPRRANRGGASPSAAGRNMQGNTTSASRPSMAPNASAAAPLAGGTGEDADSIMDMLDTIRGELNEGLERLEARLERVERRVNPNMLSGGP